LQRVFSDYQPIPWPPDAQAEFGALGKPAQPRLL
jgi:hypothetical protein